MVEPIDSAIKTPSTSFSKIKDYAAFSKLRLSSLVVFSALLTYFLGTKDAQLSEILALFFGGFLVTSASNGMNQIIEKDLDALMVRTQDRPLPTGRMSVVEAWVLASVMGISGIAILWFALNPICGILGILALFSYVVLYTSLKRISPISVFVGAFPGAIPPMLGYIAATGTFGLIPGVLFLIQFIWQFPHFWAIAWKLDEQYTLAGFKMLPTKNGKNHFTAGLMVIYCMFLIPASILPTIYMISGYYAAGIAVIASLWFLYKAIVLYKSLDDKDATKLMFASFVYLPVVLIGYLIDKL